MNRIINYIIIATTIVLFTACDALNNIQLPGGSTLGQPTDQEIGSGLKEALNVGINKGVEQLIQKDGYFMNQAIKILLPPEAQKVQSIIRDKIPGGQKLLDDVVLKMNRAAEDAANEAKPIFVNAIKEMTFADARNILFGQNNAATTYLKDKTYQNLVGAYSPKINNSLSKVGASQAWEALVKPYNKFVNSAVGKLTIKDGKPINDNLGQYVTGKALDGLFFKVTEREQIIRKDVKERTSALMQRVFGLLDKK